jgi:hypothetical protein
LDLIDGRLGFFSSCDEAGLVLLTKVLLVLFIKCGYSVTRLLIHGIVLSVGHWLNDFWFSLRCGCGDPFTFAASAIPSLSTFVSQVHHPLKITNPCFCFSDSSPFSISDLSRLTVDSLDYFLSNYQFSVSSEGALLNALLEYGRSHGGLLCHIQPMLLTPDSFSVFQNAFTFAPDPIGSDVINCAWRAHVRHPQLSYACPRH